LKGLKNGLWSFSMCVLGRFVCECCWVPCHERTPWLLGAPKSSHTLSNFTMWIEKNGCGSLSKLWSSMGSWSVCVCFFVLSIWGVVWWILAYAIYLYLGVYIINCNLGLGFFLKFNVVLGVYVV
jgi:hypothetical protein